METSRTQSDTSNPIATADRLSKAVDSLVGEGKTRDEAIRMVARAEDLSRETVYRSLRLLALPKDLQNLLRDGTLSPHSAAEVLRTVDMHENSGKMPLSIDAISRSIKARIGRLGPSLLEGTVRRARTVNSLVKEVLAGVEEKVDPRTPEGARHCLRPRKYDMRCRLATQLSDPNFGKGCYQLHQRDPRHKLAQVLKPGIAAGKQDVSIACILSADNEVSDVVTAKRIAFLTEEEFTETFTFGDDEVLVDYPQEAGRVIHIHSRDSRFAILKHVCNVIMQREDALLLALKEDGSIRKGFSVHARSVHELPTTVEGIPLYPADRIQMIQSTNGSHPLEGKKVVVPLPYRNRRYHHALALMGKASDANIPRGQRMVFVISEKNTAAEIAVVSMHDLTEWSEKKRRVSRFKKIESLLAGRSPVTLTHPYNPRHFLNNSKALVIGRNSELFSAALVLAEADGIDADEALVALLDREGTITDIMPVPRGWLLIK